MNIKYLQEDSFGEIVVIVCSELNRSVFYLFI